MTTEMADHRLSPVTPALSLTVAVMAAETVGVVISLIAFFFNKIDTRPCAGCFAVGPPAMRRGKKALCLSSCHHAVSSTM